MVHNRDHDPGRAWSGTFISMNHVSPLDYGPELSIYCRQGLSTLGFFEPRNQGHYYCTMTATEGQMLRCKLSWPAELEKTLKVVSHMDR